jgi:hypothetical protein
MLIAAAWTRQLPLPFCSGYSDFSDPSSRWWGLQQEGGHTPALGEWFAERLR